MIAAVLFDVGGTLHRSSARAELAAAVLRYVVADHIRWSDEELRRAYKESHAALRRRYAASHEQCRGARLALIAREQCAEWLAMLGVVATDDVVDAVLAEWERREPIDRYAPGAREAIVSLAARGLSLGIVSNTFRDHRVSLARDGLLPLFKSVVLSIEVGVWKPDPEIFRIACRELALPPSRIVHVGDKVDKDVAPARDAGLHAIQIGAGGFAEVVAQLEHM